MSAADRADARSRRPTTSSRRSKYDADGLVAAIVQEEGTNEVLMLGWMNEEALRRTLETGRTWFWSRSRQELLVQGRDVGRPPVGARGALRLRRRRAALRGRAGGPRRVPHRRAQLLLPCLRRRRHARPRLSVDAEPSEPSPRRVRRARARPHGRAGVARGARRPRDAGLGVREARRRGRDDPPGFLLESVEHAERWGRFSFIGRDPALTLVVRGRDGRGRSARRPPGVPTDRGALAALEALLARVPRAAPRRAAAVPRWRRRLPRLRRRARDRAPPRRPARRPAACPTRCSRVTGHVTAFDHFRQRLYLIENVFLDPTAPTTPRSTPRTTRAVARLDGAGRRAGAPVAVRPVAAARERARRRSPTFTSTMGARRVPRRGRGGARAHPRRRHLPGRARAALRPRRTRSTRSTCTGCCAR